MSIAKDCIRSMLGMVATLSLFVLAAAGVGSASAAESSLSIALATQRADALPLSAFYHFPGRVPAGPPGTLLRAHATNAYHLPPGVRAIRIAYLSRSASDRPVIASAVVLLPFGKVPRGGWPVIAWAHGTSGVARICAPSLMKNLYYGWMGLFEYPMLGYAVVATDYAGLGTRSPHQYMSIAAQAHDVIYSIPAARAAVPALGKRWVAVGHSQGGSAVLKVAELESSLRDPGFLGTVSLAPPSDLNVMWHRYTNANRSVAGYLDIIALGIEAADPAFNPREMLGEAALAKLPEIRREACLQAASKLFGRAKPGAFLRPHWADLPAVVRFAKVNRPYLVAANRPILLLQGTADHTIPPAVTHHAAIKLCRLGDRLEYQTFPGMNHIQLVDASLRAQMRWISARFAGSSAPVNCPAVLSRANR